MSKRKVWNLVQVHLIFMFDQNWEWNHRNLWSFQKIKKNLRRNFKIYYRWFAFNIESEKKN